MLRFQRSIIVILAVALISGATARKLAQQAPAAPNPQPQSPSATQTNQDVVRINTQLVQVDAVVTDRKGRHVEDLTEDDFELFVDGKKQPLTHFSHISLPTAKREAPTKTNTPRAPESMPTRQIAPEEARRTIAFIVDDLGLTFQSMALVRETLKTFVKEQMQEGDLVAIIRTGNGLGMLEQFTSDKRILYTAIEKLMWNPLSRDMTPTFDDTSGTDEMSEAEAEQQAEQQAVNNSFEEFRETSFTTGTLGATNFVIRSLRGLPGRKTAILLSDGFRINGRSGAAGSRNNNDNNTQQILQALQSLVEQANRSSVVIYAMDAKGLQPYLPGANVGGRPSASAHSDALQTAQETLEGPVFLAQQTGGFAVFNTNDLNIGIAEALYDQQSYYLLGFDPEDEKFDRRHHSIKLKVKRPGLKVRTRSGFFGVDESERERERREQPKTRAQQIFSALLSPFGARDLSLRMTPYFFNSSKEGPLVRALFHIDCSKLTFKDGPDGRKQANLELAAFVFDEEGDPIDLAARRFAINLDEKQYRQAMAEGLAYRADFQLKKPGAFQFRAALRDAETGRVGSASQFIQAPDLSKNRLALSGLVLTTPKTAPTTGDNIPSDKAAAALAANASPERSEKESGAGAHSGSLQASAYVRRFPRTGWIQYGAAIYNAIADKKTGKPQITVQAEIYHDGKRAYQFPARSLEFSPGVNPKRFDYVGYLRLNDFPEGDYLLRLIVTDNLAKKKFARAEQWMDFSVK
jgi:VWFA-related protein